MQDLNNMIANFLVASNGIDVLEDDISRFCFERNIKIVRTPIEDKKMKEERRAQNNAAMLINEYLTVFNVDIKKSDIFALLIILKCILIMTCMKIRKQCLIRLLLL